MTNHASSERLQESQPVVPPIESRPFFARLYHFLPDWLALNALTSVRQKIGWGYAIVVGATLASMLVGIYFDRSNRRIAHARTVELATQQLEIERLHSQLLLVQLQTQNLIDRAARSARTPAAIATLQASLEDCVRLADSLKLTADELPAASIRTLPRFGIAEPAEPVEAESRRDPDRSPLKIEATDFEIYATTIARYAREIEAILAARADAAEPFEATRELEEFASSEAYTQFRDRTDEVSQFRAELDDLYQWLKADLEQSERLSLRIWAIGTGASIGLTALAIIYISGIISYPLSFVTAFAQRITQESNYRLHIPKISNDEVGKLTEAIDTLVRQVETDREEIRGAQTQLVQAEKMSSLGQMVAGVAHEINNPVNFIYGNLAHLETSLEDTLSIIEQYQTCYPEPVEDVTELLEEVEFDFLREDIPKQIASMRMGAERIRQIVLSLRMFSRLDEASHKIVDLHAGIDSTLALLDHRLKSGVQLVKRYGELPLVDCYPAQLNQVWMNLLANSLDSFDVVADRFSRALSQPTISIETYATERYATIKIRDNGVGIPEDTVHRIFDPFFTTKPIGKGTGLGLSVCFAVIERHGGQLRVRSQPDVGTEVTAMLPLSRTNALRNPPSEHFS